VFERFRQVDSSTTRLHGGLGLGLAIVRHLVELHGGTVTAESEGAGRGATFTIQLPIRTVVTKDDVVRGHFPAAEPTTDTRRIDLSSLHILVADDDEDSRDIVAGALAEAGASVTTADSVQSALDLLHERRADLVISDIGMPGEDGYSFIRRLRALPAKDGGRIPAIALTAYARPEDAAHALAAGFDRHLVKPVDPDRLTATVAELAASRNAS